MSQGELDPIVKLVGEVFISKFHRANRRYWDKDGYLLYRNIETDLVSLVKHALNAKTAIAELAEKYIDSNELCEEERVHLRCFVEYFRQQQPMESLQKADNSAMPKCLCDTCTLTEHCLHFKAGVRAAECIEHAE